MNLKYDMPLSSPDDDEFKICVVCNDRATGYHFNAMTCEGCKGFFRRTIKNSRKFVCSYTGNCIVTRQNRRQCQACRFEKCLNQGMKRECILSENELNKKRKIIQRNKIRKILNEADQLSPEEMSMLDHVSRMYNISESESYQSVKNFRHTEDMPSIAYAQKQSQCDKSTGMTDFINTIECRLKGLTVIYVENRQTKKTEAVTVNTIYIKHFSDIMTQGIFQFINFVKQIPEFTALDQNDQVALIKSAAPEAILLKAATFYDASQAKFITFDCDLNYGFDELSEIGLSKTFIDRLKTFLAKFNQLDLCKDEFILINLAVLFSSDRVGLFNTNKINHYQERYTTILEKTMNLPEAKAKYNKNRLPDVITLLSEIRQLVFMYRPLSTALHCQMPEGVIPALLKEMML